MKYIKDIKAILSEISMAFFSARVHEVNRFFCLPQRKKETGKKGKGKRKRKLEKKEKQRKSGRRKEVLMIQKTIRKTQV